MNAITLDIAALRALTDGDYEFEERLKNHFVQTLAECMSALRSAVSDVQWQQAAHRLKGAAASLRAAKLAQLCAEAEKAQRAQRPDFCTLIEQEAEQVVAVFTELLQQ